MRARAPPARDADRHRRDQSRAQVVPPAPSDSKLSKVMDAIKLMGVQLAALGESASASGTLRRSAQRVHAAFGRCNDLCRMAGLVTDHPTFYELLTTFTAAVKALSPGNVLVFPGGWKGGNLIYILHCITYDHFTLAVCSSGDGISYHPPRLDPATGATQCARDPGIVIEISGSRRAGGGTIA